MNALADIVLLGTSLRIDAAAAVIILVVLSLCIVLGVACRPSLQKSRAARIAFAFVLIGALVQVLAGELLLFLTGGAIVGYAMLALGLSGPRALTRFHALAAAVLIVAGDLALLELVMLLAKSSPDLTYEGTGAVLSKVMADPLARFCLVLGFGSRLGLVALCIPEGRSSAANVATLPGWLLLGVSSTVGAVRLSCGGGFGTSCAAPLVGVLWWVPVLAVVAWQLPRAIPAFLRLVGAAGAFTATLRDMIQEASGNVLHAIARHIPAALLAMERRLSLWPVAMGVLLLLLAVFALLLVLSPAARAADSAREPAPALSSDRPGLGDGTWVLAPGVWQAELGATARETGADRIGEGTALLRVGLSSTELRVYLPSPFLSVEGAGTELGDLGLGLKVPLARSMDWRWSVVAGATVPTGTDAVSADEAGGFATLVGETSLTERLALAINAGTSLTFDRADEATFSFIPTLSWPLAGKVSAYAGYAGYFGDDGDQHWLETGVAIGESADLQWDINSAYDTENDAWFLGVGVSIRWR